MSKPIGTVTRGTTNPNRLRRVDRWITFLLEPLLRRDSDRLVVDLGFGANGVTPGELHQRLRQSFPLVRTLGVEIDPERVRAALPWRTAGLDFALGGFEVPTPGGECPVLIRAYNVLRQYDVAQVPAAWQRMLDRLAPDGYLIEGTCDEIGKKCVWVTIPATPGTGTAAAAVPETLTISVDTSFISQPSDVADRLPKILIHRNVPGERIHDWLQTMDRAWHTTAGMGSFSHRQHWIAMCSLLKEQGEPVLHTKHRWRLGEITVPWERVAPTAQG